jgi:dimethylpropiothetin dethiomethylase
LLANAQNLAWNAMYAHYDAEPDMAAFRRVYGYVDLIGPRGPLQCDSVYMGVSLQGPDAYYPPHAHQAVETYFTIGGTGDWKRGAEPWTSRPPGDVFLHTSGVRHATQSNTEPLLALAFWTSDLEGPIIIVRG